MRVSIDVGEERVLNYKWKKIDWKAYSQELKMQYNSIEEGWEDAISSLDLHKFSEIYNWERGNEFIVIEPKFKSLWEMLKEVAP